jgi:hypothetical protein
MIVTTEHPSSAVADLAVETIDGCDFASISVLDGGQVILPAGTDPVVAEVDPTPSTQGCVAPWRSACPTTALEVPP